MAHTPSEAASKIAEDAKTDGGGLDGASNTWSSQTTAQISILGGVCEKQVWSFPSDNLCVSIARGAIELDARRY
jgi:hypothetical protein